MKIFLSVLIVLGSIKLSFSQSIDDLGKQYSLGNLDFVINEGLKILNSNPEEPQLNMLVGRALSDKGEHGTAIPYLEKATEFDIQATWISSWSYGYLGSCYFMKGQFFKSKAALEKALKLNATKNSNKYAYRRTLLFGTNSYYNSWTIDSTEQIIFHFQNDITIDKESFMNDRQLALQNILHDFPTQLPKKIDFFVWDSQDDATKILKTNLGFSDPSYLVTHSRKEQTTGHELTHIISHYSLQPTSKSRFINEGLATFYDQTHRNRIVLAKKAYSELGQNIRIEEMWRNANLYSEELIYTVGAAWIEYSSQKLTKNDFILMLKNQTIDDSHKLIGEPLQKVMNSFLEELSEN